MTAEQIAELGVMVKSWWRHTREEVAALDAAIALAEQTCETCAMQTDHHPDLPDLDSPSCLVLGWPCAMMGNRCGAWKAKEER